MITPQTQFDPLTLHHSTSTPMLHTPHPEPQKFLFMEDFSLVVFDEAHHTKKGHHFARVMEIYFTVHPKARPKILALSATLVEPQETEKETGMLLAETAQRNLDCKIAVPVSELGRRCLADARIDHTPEFHQVEPDAAFDRWAEVFDDYLRSLHKVSRVLERLNEILYFTV